MGVVRFQLLPSFTVSDFKNIEQFLDRLPHPCSYDYAVGFIHRSLGIEGSWEMLKQYSIAAVMTDSQKKENLQYLSDVVVTADHSAFKIPRPEYQGILLVLLFVFRTRIEARGLRKWNK